VSDDGTDVRGLALRVLKWAVALGAFWIVAREVPWRETLTRLADIDPAIVVAVIAVTVVEFGTRFSMWYALLGIRETAFATAARIDLVIKFVNHVVPSKASGHSVAPVVIRHYTGREWTDAVTVAGLNTGLYAALYGTVALVGLLAVATRLPRGVAAVVALSVGLYLFAGATVLAAGRRLDAAGALLGRLEGAVARIPRVGARLAGLVAALPTFTDESAALFRRRSARPSVVVPYALGWAGTLMVVPGIRVWLLLGALGQSFAPLWLLPVALVTAYSVTVLPLTPGGVGVAEASATLVLVSLGVGEGAAAAVILLDRALGVYLPALLGWVPAARIDLRAVFAAARDGG